MVSPLTADWFVPLADPAAAARHVYAIPQAGGGLTAFGACAAALAPEVALWGLNLPGRQARFAEPPCTELEPLLSTLAGAAGQREPWLLFGYCSGALLAFLLARRMRAAGGPMPAGLIVASQAAPDLARPPATLHELPPDKFWAEIVSYGGVPPRVAEQPDFREIFEPSLRADYALLAGYRHRAEAPLDLPITVLVGAADPVLRPADLAGWRRHTTGPFAVHEVAGAHWLLDSESARVAEIIRRCAS